MRSSTRSKVVAVALAGSLASTLVGCDTVPRQVRIVEVVQNAESEIGLMVDACGGDVSVDAEEGRHAVTATVTARDPSGDDCLEVVELSLSEPLGNRVIVDGSSGAVVPVTRPEAWGSPLVGDLPDGASMLMPEMVGAGESETLEFTTEMAAFAVVVACEGPAELVVSVNEALDREVSCDGNPHEVRIADQPTGRQTLTVTTADHVDWQVAVHTGP